MKKEFKLVTTIALILFVLPNNLLGQNPIIQTCFTGDPAPLVYDDTFYIYTGFDRWQFSGM
ncbi:hypothetical protein GGR06_003051 [Bacteroides reticulotermitis]|uniref:Glycosyl hydrolase family 43 n=1 Tax=Bacteroides reticulotermitis TaxID=1133319 RepID=A0A840CZF9_9BACE|nr:hypothetical protein [Bacteroides reticulotermitis]MBB4045240.1 hypothetical protein [Bacteroides reticulotermitis]